MNISYVYDARIVQCWPSYSVPTMTTSYFYNDERDQTAVVANNMCGLVAYHFGVSCQDLPAASSP
jgi:hypothetical protein